MQTRKVVVGIAVALLVLFVAALIVGGMMGGRTVAGYGRGMMGGFGLPFGTHMFGGGWMMILFGVLILGGLVLLVSYLVQNHESPARKDEAPMEILRCRYAGGEIDREEFERVKESLQR